LMKLTAAARQINLLKSASSNTFLADS